jgi:hypothetical protein
MSYRPITDVWILARPKVPYYGAYPGGFVHRARELLGVTTRDSVFHVCAGRVRDYPFRGVGPNDRTLDIDAELRPDFVHDARLMLTGDPANPDGWPAILADPPYSSQDAAQYRAGAEKLPAAGPLLARCLDAVRPGGRVGMLHTQWPRPPKVSGGYPIRAVAIVAVVAGYGNSLRAYAVYEKSLEKAIDAPEQAVELAAEAERGQRLLELNTTRAFSQ